MIDYTVVRRLVEEGLSNSLAVVPTVPIIHENTTKNVVNVEHIMVEDDGNTSEDLEMGGSAKLLTGLLHFHIYTERGVGTERAKAIASAIVDILPTISEDISYNEISLQSIGVIEELQLYKHILTASYLYVYGQ